MISRIAAALLAAQLFASGSALADCNTDLKPTDGNKEVSEKLKCLAGEITALKKQAAAKTKSEKANETAAGTDKGTLKRSSNGCLNAMPGDTGSIITSARIYTSSQTFCWSDGVQFMRLATYNDTQAEFEFFGIDRPKFNHGKFIKYAKHDDADFEIKTAKLTDENGNDALRVELKISPKAK